MTIYLFIGFIVMGFWTLLDKDVDPLILIVYGPIVIWIWPITIAYYLFEFLKNKYSRSISPDIKIENEEYK